MLEIRRTSRYYVGCRILQVLILLLLRNLTHTDYLYTFLAYLMLKPIPMIQLGPVPGETIYYIRKVM